MEKKQNRKITIDEIAKDLGCSKSTVSRALSGKGRIGAELRDKIVSYSSQQGYSPNVAARALAESKTYNVAVILPSDQEINEIPFFQNCLLGISDTASDMGYDVLVVTVEGNSIAKIKQVVENHKVDCAIVTRTLIDDATVAYLQGAELPFLVIGTVLDDHILQVNSHHREAGKEFTALLVSKKIMKPSFIGGCMNHTVSQKRLKGFEEGMALQNKIVDDSLVYLNCNTKESVFLAVEDLVTKDSDCIICMDDKICSQVLLKLNELHLAIPEQVQVASLYDSLFLQSYHTPVTALHFDERELGKTAGCILLESLQGSKVAQKTYLGYEIMWRKSTQ